MYYSRCSTSIQRRSRGRNVHYFQSSTESSREQRVRLSLASSKCQCAHRQFVCDEIRWDERAAAAALAAAARTNNLPPRLQSYAKLEQTSIAASEAVARDVGGSVDNSENNERIWGWGSSARDPSSQQLMSTRICLCRHQLHFSSDVGRHRHRLGSSSSLSQGRAMAKWSEEKKYLCSRAHSWGNSIEAEV